MTTTGPLPTWLPSPDPRQQPGPGPQVEHRRWWQRAVPSRAGEQAWSRPALLVLLSGTALLYLWGLSRNGWANAFYSAAAQAGSVSWKAFFFGSFDSSNFITVDKPPASLWVTGLSARLFGVNSWSILVPQALMGVASVGALYATVRRWFGPAAGLIAGTVLALTPVATLMFRFNNPDALLVLLLVLAAYAVTRAIESASTGWLLVVGILVGLGFLTKMMQAFLVVPAFALAYLVVADTPLRRRVLQLLAAGAAMLVSAGWWVAVVELWPADSRPYIGGSQDNSILSLILGYNGLGRLTGDEVGSVTGGPGGAGAGSSMWGATGITRLFNLSYGGQASWLIPAALILLAGLVWLTWRAPRTDRTRAAALVWGGWLLVTGITFSFMAGIIHQYYTVALAPAIGALVGIGSVVLWRHRQKVVARALLSVAVLATTGWAVVLLGRSPGWAPWLAPIVVLAGAIAGLGLLPVHRTGQVVIAGLVAVVAVAGLSAPAAYSLQTAATVHTGAIVTAGPAVEGGLGGFGRPGGGQFGGGQPGGGQLGGGQFGGGQPGGGQGQPPVGAGGAGQPPSGRNGAAGGGLLAASTPSAALVALLETGYGSYTWAAATVGSNSAAGFQLATGLPMMAIGGFNGSDPAPTLEQFEQYVASGQVHYFVAGGLSGASNGGSAAAQQISAWVASTFESTTVGGTTVYDLST